MRSTCGFRLAEWALAVGSRALARVPPTVWDTSNRRPVTGIRNETSDVRDYRGLRYGADRQRPSFTPKTDESGHPLGPTASPRVAASV